MDDHRLPRGPFFLIRYYLLWLSHIDINTAVCEACVRAVGTDRFVGEQVTQQPECLHEDADVAVGQKMEELVRPDRTEDLALHALVGLERQVLTTTHRRRQQQRRRRRQHWQLTHDTYKS